jgi:chromosome segregation ATPase
VADEASAASAAAVSEPAAEPNIIQLALAAAKSKSGLIRERDDAQSLADSRQAVIEDLTGRLEQAEGRAADLATQLEEANTQLAQVRDALTAAETAQTTAEKAALEIVSTLGVSAPEALPEQAASGDTIEDLEARLATEPDPKKRYDLAQKINLQLGMLN